MKAKKKIIHIVTGLLIAMTLVSIGLMLAGGKGINDIISESFSLVVEVAALSIAVISQIDSNKEEKRLQKIISDLRVVVNKNQAADATRERLEAKEDKLLRGQAEIAKQIKEVKSQNCEE